MTPIKAPIQVTPVFAGGGGIRASRREKQQNRKTGGARRTLRPAPLPGRRGDVSERQLRALWAQMPIPVHFQRRRQERFPRQSLWSGRLTGQEQGCALKGRLLYAALPAPSAHALSC